MTENEKLRNENQTLRNLKIAKLKAEQQKVNEDDISSKMKEHDRQLAERELASGIASNMMSFSQVKKTDHWTHLKSNESSFMCDHIYRQSIKVLEACSYQFNIKIVRCIACRWMWNISTDCRLLYKVILRSGIPRRVFEHYWHCISVGCRPSLLPIDRMLSSVNL